MSASDLFDPVAEQSMLGGLERWLDDPSVTEVIVNGGGDVWVERAGRLHRVGTMRAAAVLTALEHILGPIGRRLDRSSPMVDARLADGSRVCAVIPPVAVDGPLLAIRRFAVRSVALQAFAPPPVVAVLEQLVAQRCNVIVSGPTSSGKTTLLNSLAGLVLAEERLITLEDVAELRLDHPHVVRLETRAASADSVGEVTLADLLRTALRLRPDRLVVGEIRGAEAVELLQALNTGHDGSLATVHANSAEDALARVTSLIVQHTAGWPLAAVREQVHRAVDAVVHVARGNDGRRRVAHVAEVVLVPQPGSTVRHLVDGHRVLGALERRR
ncbi:MAG: putative secretion ATPase [Ilumatobacteraceae bacterium]|nr:putative secretion ATPase [Ilumatobacteraceae bacterium]